MPTFQYRAKTRAGELISGTLAAGDRRLALAELGRLGHFPLAVEAAAEEQAAPRKFSLGNRVGRRDIQMFSQQLSTLLRSGMSLNQGLAVLKKRVQKPAVRELLSQIHEDIVQGQTLSAALGRHPRQFSNFEVNLIKAGEASGALDEVLARLTKHHAEMGALREKVVGALMYPLIIALVGLGTILFFMTSMVPKFATMFKEMNRAMPLPTQILIAVSDLFLSFWWLGVGLLIVGVILYMQFARTAAGRRAVDGWKLRAPVLGPIVQANAFTQFARTLATLLENGVPVLTALEIVEASTANRVVASEIAAARTRVTDGTSISQPLAKGRVFPPLLLDMLAVGEESGEVVPALKNIGDMYEQDLAHRLRLFTTLLEPAIILLMAVGVGSVVLSVLMAVFDLTSGIGK